MMMKNWIGFGMNWSWPNFKVLSWHSPEGTQENHERTSIGIADRRGREQDPGPLTYEVGVSNARPRLLVMDQW
jgi:hypothetical protein